MCRAARAEGVGVLLATPRWPKGATAPPLGFEECGRRLERLRRAARGESPQLRLGFVLQFDEGLPALVERHGARLALGGGRHLLVSLPALETPAAADSVWEELARLGFAVVLARPECSPALRRDAARLDHWADAGVLMQLDASSVTGAYGREVQRFAWRCVERYGAGRVVVASNARDASARRPSLGEAAEMISKRLGRARARALVEDGPAQVLSAHAPHRLSPPIKSPAGRVRAGALLRSLLTRKTLPEEG
jgi:protein-tyrosine phosphatase